MGIGGNEGVVVEVVNFVSISGISILNGDMKGTLHSSLPPRAQYFVVVGGLACCKDDLGCAR